MKIPSEELIQSVISEIERDREVTHGHKHDDSDKCDFCLLCEEFSKRNENYKSSGICALDSLVRNLTFNDPQLGILVGLLGGKMIEDLILISRVSFLVGLKAGKSMIEQENLNKMFSRE